MVTKSGIDRCTDIYFWHAVSYVCNIRPAWLVIDNRLPLFIGQKMASEKQYTVHQHTLYCSADVRNPAC